MGAYLDQTLLLSNHSVCAHVETDQHLALRQNTDLPKTRDTALILDHFRPLAHMIDGTWWG